MKNELSAILLSLVIIFMAAGTVLAAEEIPSADGKLAIRTTTAESGGTVQLIDRRTERVLLDITPTEGDLVTASWSKSSPAAIVLLHHIRGTFIYAVWESDGHWIKQAGAGQGAEKINEIVARSHGRISQETTEVVGWSGPNSVIIRTVDTIAGKTYRYEQSVNVGPEKLTVREPLSIE
jgi:hypothetical protein